MQDFPCLSNPTSVKQKKNVKVDGLRISLFSGGLSHGTVDRAFALPETDLNSLAPHITLNSFRSDL